MTTAVSDPFTYPVDKTATDADHAPLGVALAQALEGAGLTKVSGPTTLGEWEIASLAGDATMIWDFNDTIDGQEAHLYVRFILRTGIEVKDNDTGWAVSVSKYADFNSATAIEANWFVGQNGHTRPGSRYFVSFSESCLVAHVDYPLPVGLTQVSANGLCIERSRAGTTPDKESVALFVIAADSNSGGGASVFKTSTIGLMESTYSASYQVQHPIGDPTGNGKMLVNPIGWFDHTGIRRTMAGIVMVPRSIGAQSIISVTNSGTSRTYITPRTMARPSWGGLFPAADASIPFTFALRWE